MKILKPGDPCPCCGTPIPQGLPVKTICLLSMIAEGMRLQKALEHETPVPDSGTQ